jgi:hypothetical protein
LTINALNSYWQREMNNFQASIFRGFISRAATPMVEGKYITNVDAPKSPAHAGL